MPQGLSRGPDLDLTDRTYDGLEENGQLSRGLGQLVDGQKGRDNFRLDLAGHGKGKRFIFFLGNSFKLNVNTQAIFTWKNIKKYNLNTYFIYFNTILSNALLNIAPLVHKALGLAGWPTRVKNTTGNKQNILLKYFINALWGPTLLNCWAGLTN